MDCSMSNIPHASDEQPETSILILDSLGGRRGDVVKSLIRYLKLEAGNKNKTLVSPLRVTGIHAKVGEHYYFKK